MAAAARLVFSLVRAQLARPDPKPVAKKRTAAPQAKPGKAAQQVHFDFSRPQCVNLLTDLTPSVVTFKTLTASSGHKWRLAVGQGLRCFWVAGECNTAAARQAAQSRQQRC